jgi:hypothetical protein
MDVLNGTGAHGGGPVAFEVARGDLSHVRETIAYAVGFFACDLYERLDHALVGDDLPQLARTPFAQVRVLLEAFEAVQLAQAAGVDRVLVALPVEVARSVAGDGLHTARNDSTLTALEQAARLTFWGRLVEQAGLEVAA